MDWLSPTSPLWWLNLQPRHIPWPESKLGFSWFMGGPSTTEPHWLGFIFYFLPVLILPPPTIQGICVSLGDVHMLAQFVFICFFHSSEIDDKRITERSRFLRKKTFQRYFLTDRVFLCSFFLYEEQYTPRWAIQSQVRIFNRQYFH